MKAELLLRERNQRTETSFVELVLWRVPRAVCGSTHDFKYRLAYVVDGICRIRYDNEAGKGDHRHVGDVEHPYAFTTPTRLLIDFRMDVERWRPE